MAGYVLIGVIFAASFVLFLVGRIDPAMRKASLPVRLLIFPGAAALWPMLLLKLRRGRAGPRLP